MNKKIIFKEIYKLIFLIKNIQTKIIFIILISILFQKICYAEIKIEDISNNRDPTNNNSSNDQNLNIIGNEGNLAIDKNLLNIKKNSKILNYSLGFDLGFNYKIYENYVAKIDLFKIKTFVNSSKNILSIDDITGLKLGIGRYFNNILIIPSLNVTNINFKNDDNSFINFGNNMKISYGVAIGYELFPSLFFQLNYLHSIKNKKKYNNELYKFDYKNIYISIAYSYNFN